MMVHDGAGDESHRGRKWTSAQLIDHEGNDFHILI